MDEHEYDDFSSTDGDYMDNYGLSEVDWVVITDYLSPSKLVQLYLLTEASNGISWAFSKIKIVPWATLLHDVDPQVLKFVLFMVEGAAYTPSMQNAYLCFTRRSLVLLIRTIHEINTEC